MRNFSQIIFALILCFLLGSEAWAQCRHQRQRACGVRNTCNQCRPQRQYRPTFNSQVGVPVRWVNVPSPAWGYGRGSYRTTGYGYGYGYAPRYGQNYYNRGYYQQNYYAPRGNCGQNYYNPYYR